MKRKMFLVLVFMVCFGSAIYSQDIITTTEGNKIQAKITEINADEVRYKNFDNQSGPVFVITGANVFTIKYENGDTDTFVKNPATGKVDIRHTNATNQVPAEEPATDESDIDSISAAKIYSEKESSNDDDFQYDEATGQTEIRTAEELAAIGIDKIAQKSSYILMNDLRLNNWTPIKFNGLFNGNGHTITVFVDMQTPKVSKLKATLYFAFAGLFSENYGIVANLHVTGSVSCSSNYVIVAVGGVAGYNGGKIVNCSSSVQLKGEGTGQPSARFEITGGGTQSSTASSGNVSVSMSYTPPKSVKPYDGGVLAGGIAGINRGYIANCYATGNIEVAGDGHKMGGGIAGGNGSDIYGVLPLLGDMHNCYATGIIYVHDDNKNRIAGGVTGMNVHLMENCVALNDKIVMSGVSKNSLFSFSTDVADGVLGINYSSQSVSDNGYYRDDIDIRLGQIKLKKEEPDGIAITLPSTQQQDWWENSPKFAFGQAIETPWIWDATLQRPVLYWEKFAVDPTMPLTSAEEKAEAKAAKAEAKAAKEAAKNATEGQLTPEISWKIENGTLTVSGVGDIPGAPGWYEPMKNVTSVIIEDGITCLGHHAFASSKISSIVIGANVTSIKTYGFFGCKNLVLVEVKSAKPPKIGAFVFLLSSIDKAKLIVPAGAKAAYASDKSWKKFGTIEEN
jgi:hypothetical protein